LIALQSGGYSHPWSSAYTLCTLLIGLALLIAFCVWEWRFAKNPMVPAEIFRGQYIVGLAFGIAFISGMNFYSILTFFPILYEDVYTPTTPISIGLKALGPGLSTAAGVIVMNALLSVFKNHNREVLMFSCILMTVFGGALAAITPETPRMAVAFATIAGFGIGGVLVPSATIALTVAPDAFIATTVALSLSIRVVGGSIGYSIYYNVFVNKLAKKLPVYLADYAIAAGLPITSAVDYVTAVVEAPSMLAQVPGVTPAIIETASLASRWAYCESLKYVWFVSIAFGVMACIACAFLGNIRPYLTHRIAVELS